MKYTDVFFDLDNTLWNFEKSSQYALAQVFDEFNLKRFFKDFEDFYQSYKELNNKLWNQYRRGEISKDTLSVVRFLYLLEERTDNVMPKLAEQISTTYLAKMTIEPYLEPNAYETIKTLYDRQYRIHIISDGFFEVQILKLKVAKLSPFISQIITAEEVGVLKPDKRLFEYALNKANANKDKSIFVGDDYQNDILGAYNFGIDQIFYNRKKIDVSSLNPLPTYIVEDLKQILDIL